ncbi:pyrroline-5-carboxylate reductase dimerization-domain-containing protein [Aspergillus transmontanensis]|uniref:Pyrroline-5-carboxylate reductase dimerization-domain-containing protein n=1 Tax=Aspergillus transmontanensis TaxID=1034304 RepID=A0A5N6W8G2_9EURO|nr:pyrroline-5-carboxylate reductase dimerization-domain-containing protein [Aspergillus transmontanensis]
MRQRLAIVLKLTNQQQLIITGELPEAIANKLLIGMEEDWTRQKHEQALYAIAGGATAAFSAVVCDAQIVAAVAVGLSRDLVHTVISQSIKGTATMLQSGMHPAMLKDQGTSPEGCTIGGLIILEDGAVRCHLGRALREAATLACLMETTDHVNYSRK